MALSSERRVYQRSRSLGRSERRLPLSQQQDAFPEEGLPASPLRVGHSFGLHPEDTPTQSGPLPRDSVVARVPPSAEVKRAAAHTLVPLDSDLLEDADLAESEEVPWRTCTSVVVRRGGSGGQTAWQSAGPTAPSTAPSPIPPRARALVPLSAPHQTAEPLPSGPPRRSARRVHWLVWMGGGMLVTVGLVIFLGGLPAWWHHLQDDWRYGFPRTFQIDAVVGHGDSPTHPSHFIALNLRGQIEVIELPGGDSSHAQLYVGPRLYDALGDQAPVTLAFVDRNHDGKPEMDLFFEGVQVRWPNNGTTFVPPRG